MTNTAPTLRAQCLAEFLGTALLIFFGTGCVAAMKVAGAGFGLWEISIVWGIGVSMGIYLTAGISGAHLNPAVSIALWLFAGFERRKVPFYILAQVLGAFCSAALVYTLYSNLFFDFEQSHGMVRGSVESLELASIFSTYPNAALSVGQAFLVEVVITAILMGVIMALTDDNNGLRRGPMAPLLIGLLIAVIGSAMGPLTGFAMNPARDFGPKLMTFLAGWGEVSLTGGRDIPYFLIPIVAPILGACLGAAAYRGMIARHLPSVALEPEQADAARVNTPVS
ncbi:MIP/aquaporin family protein [Pseudomonas sp. 22-AL-CL-001]|uniref:MIP/aquaporin family protein n=1 Tax=Pseudomonas alabamensis TaxID=3064349 RepID=UPI002712332D|nr:MIP/aquaporin family protein [Pseudomonas sp. 22-AL-CL-001]MDO7911851.1 MIP/aquaporin family protein [Pseudomonas sp. 22-AL-CL-001]